MVITSLIFLLLSNSITLRRDKSILYSRAFITILLIPAFIAYDNLSFLFLNKGIEILLVYPYSVSGYTNDIYGLVIMMVFFVLLTLGFIFELGKNALTIDSRQTSSYNSVDSSEYHAFLTSKNILHSGSDIGDLAKREFTILMLLTVPTVILGIYPALILDGLAYGVSLLLYNSDILVAASSVPLSDAHDDLIKKADKFNEDAERQVSSINEMRYASNNNREVLEDNVRKEEADIRETHAEIASDLRSAMAQDPSRASEYEDKIHVIRDACSRALTTLQETKDTALELMDDNASDAVLFIVGQGILAESLVGPFFVFVSTVLKLYSNKPFRYAFKA